MKQVDMKNLRETIEADGSIADIFGQMVEEQCNSKYILSDKFLSHHAMKFHEVMIKGVETMLWQTLTCCYLGKDEACQMNLEALKANMNSFDKMINVILADDVLREMVRAGEESFKKENLQ